MDDKAFIGTSGWNYDHWGKRFYPEFLLKKEWFGFYAKTFNTVEINYSFYRWPTNKNLREWEANSPKDFLFTLKIPRTITHIKRLAYIDEDVANFYKLSRLLKRKMGCFLFQLPPNFSKNERNYERVKNLLKIMDKKKRNVVEFRHKSWWTDEVYELLHQEKVTFCNPVGLGMPEIFVDTTPLLYVRFHGEKYHSNFDRSSLKKWAEKIRGSSAREIFAYFNNDQEGYAPENAKDLRKLLKI